MYSKARLLFALQVFLLFSGLPAPVPGRLSAQGTVNKNIAGVYVGEAKKAYDEGNIEKAFAIISDAAQFAENYGDYYALAGFIADRRSEYWLATEYFEKALQYHNGSKFYTTGHVREALYPLYYRRQQYNEIIKSYRSDPGKSYDPNAFYYLLSLQKAGRPTQLADEAEQLMLYYPFDFRLYFAMTDQPDFQARYLEPLRFLAENRPDFVEDAVTRSVILSAIRQISDEDLQQDLLSVVYNWLRYDLNYRRMCSLHDVLIPVIDENDAHVLSSLYTDIDFMTEEMLTAAMESSEEIVLGRDSDLDGFPDETGVLHSAAAYWQYDTNQDGRAEYRINIKEGLISTIDEWRGPNILTWEFSNYPYVNTVTVTTPQRPGGVVQRRLIYHLLPGRLNLNKTETTQSLIAKWTPLPVFNTQDALPEEWLLLQNSFQLDEYLNSLFFRKMKIVKGEVVTVAEDTEGRGRFDHLYVVKNWQIEYGKRDINGDGRFDVYEYYENGIWQGLAYAPDNDGIITYFEDWHVLQIKLWDFNKDGYTNAYILYNPENGTREVTPAMLKQITPQEFLSWNFDNAENWFSGSAHN
jgi:tetratricopeptide (TPR) repeat protein